MANSIDILKAVADDTRVKILRALKEHEMSNEMLAEHLSITPATVSFHMKKLLAAGLLVARREQYSIMYSIRDVMFEKKLSEMVFDAAQDKIDPEAAFRAKVIKSFMPNGYCVQMPAQAKKRAIIYKTIFDQFEGGKTYTENEVNDIIFRMYADYCTTRREFIGFGWMTRENGIYTVNPNPEMPEFK